MKSQPKSSNHLRKLTYLLLCLFSFSYLLSMNGDRNIFYTVSDLLDVNDDTIPEEISYGDTVSYADGADTIFQINDSIPDSLAMMMDIEPTGNIYMTFGGASKAVNQAQYGIHIGGMFDHSTMPNDGTSQYGWQWLIDLAPEVLRFPSGSYSRFMHLLHNTNGTQAVGYGYNVFEIARYYDWTDDTMNYTFSALSSMDSDHILNDNLTELSSWINANQVVPFDNFRKKWFSQQCETRRYIDDFIKLVNQIDSAYPGRPATKVILDLNIVSERATECRAIADTLRAHNVNVVGVEMGNETYGNFYCDAMEFQGFEDYYKFIKGTNLTGNSNVLLNLIGTNDMWDDHDYITKFKTGGGFNYKIGVCGMPLGGEFAFKRDPGDDGCALTSSWNDTLRRKYYEKVTGSSKYRFDAVIMHTYYEPDNWQDIPKDHLDPVTTCTDDSDLWSYDTYDSRLKPAFDTIIGIGNKIGNFRWFLTRGDTVSYKASMDEFNRYFDFDLPSDSAFRKELWTTEWNLKDESKNLDGPEPEDDADPLKIAVYSNGFTHGYLQFQWWLKNMKINYDNDYYNNFYSYATVQNFAGGTSTDLVSTSDTLERAYYSTDTCPYANNCFATCAFDDNWDKRIYHIRRTTYFTTYMISEIYKKNLKYVPANFYLGSSNLNMQPTVFITPAKDTLYIYYSNVKNDFQNYIIDPGTIASLYTGALGVDLGLSTVTYLQAKQLYSTSGKSSLFDSLINYCYLSTGHPFEIKALTEAGLDSAIITSDNDPDCGGGIIYPNGCLSAPPYSLGYFKVPIEPFYIPKKLLDESNSNIHLYPNPTATYFKVKRDNISANDPSKIDIKIMTLNGSIIFETNANYDYGIEVSNLPAGCYVVRITDEGSNNYYKQLIKTE